MLNLNIIQSLGFIPKENATGIYHKIYAGNCSIEIDFSAKKISYGSLIQAESKTTQNFSQEENWVVLECVNRLLEKGYKPQNIILEKTWAAGHGNSGRLDICVTRDDGSEYLLIECKTYGDEFDKELARMKKDGGQLFTYFKFSNKADVLMLYSSQLSKDAVIFRNEIIKIEDDYRLGDVNDFYDKWNKLTKDNGIFENWVNPYYFASKALTLAQLKPIQSDDSSLIFNQFLEILRHNVVSDKPNAFNKIFTLFLCKVYDEKSTKPGQQLAFQWLEGEGDKADDHVKFQLRLTDLYKKGMLEFLEKKVTDFSQEDFEKKYHAVFVSYEGMKNELLAEIHKLRLEKNNEFAIKEVFDKQSFLENAKIVKEVVELLQGFRLRYNKRQQYLSDFFELLLTTGLKQESGQFFTPVPIAQFIIKSLPFDQLVHEKLDKGEHNNLLPFIMDYAAGSGHFLTESMHEIQRLLDKKQPDDYLPDTAKKLKNWHEDHFDWATQYVYGVEKDYRLVKVGKVGCYLHGDGLANVILSDGLANFTNTEEYKGVLKYRDSAFPQDNKQFDVVISNPPYSVSAFKNPARGYYGADDFELYSKLTDSSSEIECLFIERTKQLLKDGGVAGIILPSSILSNGGIYTKAREIILQYFDIIAIAELGSNTFMATGTNTVTLFLRRRSNYVSSHLRDNLAKALSDAKDVTLNGIEKPIDKYLSHVWEGISFDDYASLLKKSPNETMQQHELYQEYIKKLGDKAFAKIIELETEKLFYFILAYKQKIVLVKSGEKQIEKQFLGYEFSNRRGSEGIHPMQRGKNIEDCTQLFDKEIFDNPQKASTYIYQAFKGELNSPIPDSLIQHIFRVDLVDLFNFDRVEFEKSLSLSVKKKLKIESQWDIKNLGDLVENLDFKRVPLSQRERIKGEFPYYGATGVIDFVNDFIFDERLVLIGEDGAKWGENEKSSFIVEGKYWVNNHAHVLRPIKELIIDKYLVALLNKFDLSEHITGLNVPKLNQGNLNVIKIPLPPKDIQEKIVAELEVLEVKEAEVKAEVENLKNRITKILIESNQHSKTKKLGEVCNMKAGEFTSAYDINHNNDAGAYPCYGGNGLRGYTKTFTHDGSFPLIGRQGALCGNVHKVTGKFHATEHAVVVTPLSDIDVNWLYHQLKILNLNQYKTGTAQPGLSVQNLKTVSIAVPSISQQQKIVAQISIIENQIADLENKLATLPQQKEAVLEKYL